MTWFAVSVILMIAMVACCVMSAVSFLLGLCCNIPQWLQEKAVEWRVERLLKKKIGDTLSGINDGKKYFWHISYDNNGKEQCGEIGNNGMSYTLNDAVNLMCRRAIQWGCDITKIEIERCDHVDNG